MNEGAAVTFCVSIDAVVEVVSVFPHQQIHVKSASEHAELLRKVETVNTLTAANKKLQEEKDQLVREAADLNAKVARLEADILPVEGKVKGLLISCSCSCDGCSDLYCRLMPSDVDDHLSSTLLFSSTHPPYYP